MGTALCCLAALALLPVLICAAGMTACVVFWMGVWVASGIRTFFLRGLCISFQQDACGHRKPDKWDRTFGVALAALVFASQTDSGHRAMFRCAHKAVNAVSYITRPADPEEY